MELFGSYSSAEFLVLYILMVTTALAASFWFSGWLRPKGYAVDIEDLEEVAVLARGAERHADAVLSDLLARGAIAAESPSKLVAVHRIQAHGPAAQVLADREGPFTLAQAKIALEPRKEQIEAALVQRGLMIAASERWQLRMVAAVPLLVVLALGEFRRASGEALGEPTGFLVILMVLTAVLALWRWFALNPRTQAGNAAVDRLRHRSWRLKRAPEQGEVGLAVAMFGTMVLAGTPWEPLHAMRQASSSDGSGGGDSNSDGGCGGGCGGCGG